MERYQRRLQVTEGAQVKAETKAEAGVGVCGFPESVEGSVS